MPNQSQRASFVAMLTLGGGLLAGVAFVEPAHAQYYGSSYYGPSPFFGNFYPYHRPRMRPRVRRFSPSYERPSYARRPLPRRLHPQPDLPATAPAPRKLEQAPTRVGLVIGDTMAEWLAYGLEEAFAETPEIGVVRKIKASAGLAGKCKGELQAWLQDSLAVEKGEKLAFVAIMIGTADRRPIRNCPVGATEATDSKAAPGAPQAFAFHSDEWPALYAARVGEVVSVLKSKGVPVYWVGLPPMRNVRDADIEVLNDIYEARAEKAGAKFVEVWDSFVDESGDYAVRGPDIDGQTRRLRASDGTYFTKAGARKLAWHLEKEIKPIMAARPQVATPPPEPSAGAPADKRASRPVAGPVVPLDTFATPSKPEQLVGGVARNSSTGPVAGRASNNRDQPPVEIRRADDFTWPRTQAQSPDAETQLEGAPQSPRPDREGTSARD